MSHKIYYQSKLGEKNLREHDIRKSEYIQSYIYEEYCGDIILNLYSFSPNPKIKGTDLEGREIFIDESDDGFVKIIFREGGTDETNTNKKNRG